MSGPRRATGSDKPAMDRRSGARGRRMAEAPDAGEETADLQPATAPLRVLVEAPATSANLGPGFDALGLCLDWWHNLEASIAPEASLHLSGQDAEALPASGDNLICRAMDAFADEVGKRLPPLRLELEIGFPVGRGFGSSAAGIVIGLLAARAFLDPTVPDRRILAIAAELDGHADNVAACLSGGMTVSWGGADGIESTRTRVHPDLTTIALVAPEPMTTAASRRLLPLEVAMADAARTAARAALLPIAIEGRFELLLPATEDVLHQPFRLASNPGGALLLEGLRSRGFAAALSGAGPSIIVLVPRTDMPRVMREAERLLRSTEGWRMLPAEVTPAGAQARIVDAGTA